MALTSSWVGAANRIPEVFGKIRDGQAPAQVTNQLLKDWGFSSSADRAFLPLLKSLGFLTPTGQPTQRYHDYRDHSRSQAVMGEALKEAYHDLFLIKAHPTKSDQAAITGKFKSYHNASDDVAQRMAKPFSRCLLWPILTVPQQALPRHHKKLLDLHKNQRCRRPLQPRPSACPGSDCIITSRFTCPRQRTSRSTTRYSNP